MSQAASFNPTDEDWDRPAPGDASPRLSLRRSLHRFAVLGTALVVAGRDLMRGFARQPVDAPADPSRPGPDAVDQAMQCLNRIAPWVRALRRRLDHEARLARDFVYLAMALRRSLPRTRAKAAPAPANPAGLPSWAVPPSGRNAPGARAEAAGRARPRRERTAAEIAEARLVREAVDRMSAEQVMAEICGELSSAARLLDRADMIPELEAVATQASDLCAADPGIAPLRGAASHHAGPNECRRHGAASGFPESSVQGASRTGPDAPPPRHARPPPY